VSATTTSNTKLVCWRASVSSRALSNGLRKATTITVTSGCVELLHATSCVMRSFCTRLPLCAVADVPEHLGGAVHLRCHTQTPCRSTVVLHVIFLHSRLVPVTPGQSPSAMQISRAASHASTGLSPSTCWCVVRIDPRQRGCAAVSQLAAHVASPQRTREAALCVREPPSRSKRCLARDSVFVLASTWFRWRKSSTLQRRNGILGGRRPEVCCQAATLCREGGSTFR
jgi:hypothetical protein